MPPEFQRTVRVKKWKKASTASTAAAQAVALQPDGKAVVCGYIYIGGSGSTFNLDGGLARFTTDGALDTTFGGTGRVAVAFGPRDDVFNAVTVQADGKIVATGRWFNGTTSGTFDCVTARLLANGNLDASFGGAGKVITSLSTTDDFANAIAIQSDGRILIAGSANTSNTDFALARLRADGTLDTSFGGTGKVVTARTLDQQINGLGLQSDGKIIAVGPDGSSSSFRFLVARYWSTGTPDGTCAVGTGGLANFSMGASDYPTSVTIQSDDKIVVSAWSSNGSNWDFGLLRLLPNGARDPGFGTNGAVRLNLGSPQDYALSLAVQTDGRILVTGYVSNATNDGMALVRLNPDGNLDSTFGDGGKVIAFRTTGSEQGRGVAIQGDGKIVIALYPGAGVARYYGGIATPLEQWKFSQLGDIHAPDIGDSDWDGLVHLAEYALVLSPTTPSQPPGASVFTSAEGDRLRMFVPRDPAHHDITVSVEATGDLVSGPWTPLATSTLGAPFTGPGYVGGDGATPGMKTVEVRDIVNLSATTQRWLRVKVTH